MLDLNTEKMLYDYARNTALKLVYHLSQAGSDGSAYSEAAQILRTAAKDCAAGRDPGARVQNVNGRIILVPTLSCCPCDKAE